VEPYPWKPAELNKSWKYSENSGQEHAKPVLTHDVAIIKKPNIQKSSNKANGVDWSWLMDRPSTR